MHHTNVEEHHTGWLVCGCHDFWTGGVSSETSEWPGWVGRPGRRGTDGVGGVTGADKRANKPSRPGIEASEQQRVAAGLDQAVKRSSRGRHHVVDVAS